MTAAGHWPDFQQRGGGSGSQSAVTQLAFAGARIRCRRASDDIFFVVLDQPVFQKPLAQRNAPFDERFINLFDPARAKLLRQAGRRLAGASEEDHAADRTIQPMHDADEHVAGLLVLHAQVIAHLIGQGDVARAVAGSQQTGRLHHRDAMIVFVEDLWGRHRYRITKSLIDGWLSCICVTRGEWGRITWSVTSPTVTSSPGFKMASL